MVSTNTSYLSTKQVADFLNVDRKTITNLVNRRQLVALRVGKSIRIHPDALEQFISKNDTRRR